METKNLRNVARVLFPVFASSLPRGGKLANRTQWLTRTTDWEWKVEHCTTSYLMALNAPFPLASVDFLPLKRMRSRLRVVLWPWDLYDSVAQGRSGPCSKTRNWVNPIKWFEHPFLPHFLRGLRRACQFAIKTANWMRKKWFETMIAKFGSLLSFFLFRFNVKLWQSFPFMGSRKH